MKNQKLLMALMLLVFGAAKLQGYCEKSPSFLSQVFNLSSYNVLVDSESVPSTVTKNFGSSKKITNGTEVNIKQQMTDEHSKVTNINVYTLQGTENGLVILKDGNSLTLGENAVHGCNMYVEIFFNQDNSTGLRLKSGEDGHVIVTTGSIPPQYQ